MHKNVPVKTSVKELKPKNRKNPECYRESIFRVNKNLHKVKNLTYFYENTFYFLDNFMCINYVLRSICAICYTYYGKI